MSDASFLLLWAVVAIVGLIVLIARFKLHPFIALIVASGFLGLVTGLPLAKVVKEFQDGFGGTLGFVGVLLGLGTMLGKLMAESGGADRIARTLIDAFGEAKVHWAMMISAFLVGIPLFFEIGFVLLAPLVFIVARRTGVSLVKIGIPLLAGLSVVHGLVPPHPGPLLAIGAFGADIGKTILYGLIVGLPTAVIAGPVYGAWIAKRVPGSVDHELAETLARDRDAQSKESPRELPGFGVTLFTVLLPVALMLGKTFADLLTDDKSAVRQWMDFVGNPIVALLAALLVGIWTFGLARGMTVKEVGKHLDASLTPVAAILLIIGAGGGFKQMLIATGVGKTVGELAVHAQLSPILLAWLVAALIRIATGSATVATITGAGIVAPIVSLVPGVNRELLVLATGAGSLILSHVNDAGFWLVKQYFNLSLSETFKTWTAMETILSVVGIVLIMLLSMVV
jgi:GntP family gluconate:H+ symporter